MALDVWLVKPGEKPGGNNRLITQFESDGYYWYLSQYWPASSSTGKIVDLYDDAVFKGPNLAQLSGCLTRATKATDSQQSVWEEQTGWGPDRSRRYSKVEKKKLLEIIIKLQEAIVKAQEQGLEIYFSGD